MDTHFFKHLPGKYKLSWRDYYTGQNLSSVRVACVIFLMLNVVIRILYQAFPLRLTRAENFPEFDMANWVFIGSGIIFYIISHLLVEQYQKSKIATAIMSLFVFLFSLYIIACGMYFALGFYSLRRPPEHFNVVFNSINGDQRALCF